MTRRPAGHGSGPKPITPGLSENNLTGSLPLSLANLQRLRIIVFGGNDGLCAPATEEFQAWLVGIMNVDGPTCDSVP